MATIDPMQVLAMQQALGGGQLAPQGALGYLLGQLGQPLGGALGGIFGHPQLGQQLGQGLGSLATLLPFHVDPLTAAYGSGPLVPQGALGNVVGGLGGNALSGTMHPMLLNPRPNFGLTLGTPIPVGSGKGLGNLGGWWGNRPLSSLIMH